jgi:hypothetical protein
MPSIDKIREGYRLFDSIGGSSAEVLNLTVEDSKCPSLGLSIGIHPLEPELGEPDVWLFHRLNCITG